MGCIFSCASADAPAHIDVLSQKPTDCARLSPQLSSAQAGPMLPRCLAPAIMEAACNPFTSPLSRCTVAEQAPQCSPALLRPRQACE